MQNDVIQTIIENEDSFIPFIIFGAAGSSPSSRLSLP